MRTVSIILPVYNVGEYIEDCIKSIIAQRYVDFELIIINDGSKDNSIQLAEALLKRSSVDYKVIVRENGGLSAARNTGVSASSGEYLVFVDSDDVISPYYLETLVNDVKSNNVELAIANYRNVEEHNKFDFDERTILGRIVDRKEFLYKVLRHKIVPYFGGFIVAKSLIDKLSLQFDETVFFGVDQAYRWRLMIETEKYSYSEKEIYNYFVRPSSIMTGTKIHKMKTGISSIEKCAQDLKENGMIDSSWIETQWKTAALHTIAKLNTFEQFCTALPAFKPSIVEYLSFPDIRIKLSGIAATVSNRLYYELLRRK